MRLIFTFVFIFDYVQSHHLCGRTTRGVIVNLLPHIEAGGGRIGAEEGPVDCVFRDWLDAAVALAECDSMLEKI